MLRYPANLNLKRRLVEDAEYLIDKIQLAINKNGEFVLISTALTVLIEYRKLKQTEEDTQSFGSENSQEFPDDDKNMNVDDYYYGDGQNKGEKDAMQMHFENAAIKQEEDLKDEYKRFRQAHNPMNQASGQN
jgi:hypothetical protein